MAAHAQGPVTILPATTRAGTREFVELAFRLNRGDPAWVPPLKGDALDLLTHGKNTWYEHGRAQLFVALRARPAVWHLSALQIGRTACRDIACEYFKESMVDDSLKRKKKQKSRRT